MIFRMKSIYRLKKINTFQSNNNFMNIDYLNFKDLEAYIVKTVNICVLMHFLIIKYASHLQNTK